jgi:superfamily II DNA or RNA helicase
MVANNVAKEATRGRFVLVQTARIAHADHMRELILDYNPNLVVKVLHSKVTTKDREKSIKGMDVGKVNVIVGAIAMNEALTIERADSIHLMSPATGEAIIEQILGRIRTAPRKIGHKPTPLVHDYRLKGHGVVYAAAKAREKFYAQEDWRITNSSDDSATEQVISMVRWKPNRIPMVCGTCTRFFKCKHKSGMKFDGAVCRKYRKHEMKQRHKLHFVYKHRDKLKGIQAGRIIKSMLDNEHETLSDKQSKLLDLLFKEIMNHKQVRGAKDASE